MSGKIKFVKRGGGTAAIIPSTDLAAHEDGSSPPEPLDISRVQDLELPREIDILYINPNADYQQGIQISTRQAVSSVGVRTVSLPIVLSDEKAKQVADVLHYNAWVERTSYKLSLSRKWSKIEPTDILQVLYNNSSIYMRVVSKEENVAGRISLECVAEDISIYTQSGTGSSPSNVPDQVIQIPVQTVLVFLDIPILRDSDDNAGLYVAASGYREGWGGCTLFKSSDEGSTYSVVFSITSEATIGNATTVLDNYYGGFTFDELSSVIVVLYTGSLSSTTEELVLAGNNYAVIGNEIIQFKNAELVGTNTYKLTGLLRGCKGTEWAMGTHSIGDRFVLADVTTWRRIDLPSSDIGIEKLYKAPTVGTTVQRAAAQGFTNTAVGLECLSPVEVGAGRNAVGDLIINWKRRGRISAEWRDYADTSLGEVGGESYEIDIFSDNTFTTVKRTLTSITNTATYSIANQITDFGLDVTTIYLRVYQLSSLVGRGFTNNTTLYVPRLAQFSNKWRIYITLRNGGRAITMREIELRGVVGGIDLATGGVATASAETGANYASNAFDDNSGTNWQSGWDTYPQWIQYQFPTTVTLAQISMTSTYTASDAPQDWKLQYYNGSTWIDYYIKTGDASWTAGTPKTYTI